MSEKQIPVRQVLLLVLLGSAVACGPRSIKIDIKEPSSVVVHYIGAHNLRPHAKFPNVELRTASGALVKPDHVYTWSIEAHRVTEYYVLQPGNYRLFGHRSPTIKTLRRLDARQLSGQRVKAVLDPATDSNDKEGDTSETWKFAPRGPGPYFVLVEELDADASHDLRVAVHNKDGLVYPPEDGMVDSERVEGASWLGPFTGSVTIVVSSRRTDRRPYTLRVSQPEMKRFAPRSAATDTLIRGKLGPGHSNWDDKSGWTDVVEFEHTGSHRLFISASWVGGAENLRTPDLSFFDSNGYRIMMELIFHQRDGRGFWTGVSRTRELISGPLQLRIVAKDIEGRISSGRYAVCVSADYQVCDKATPQPRVRVD